MFSVHISRKLTKSHRGVRYGTCPTKSVLEDLQFRGAKNLALNAQLSQHQAKTLPTTYPIRNIRIQKSWKNQKLLDKKIHLPRHGCD
jgi:hypothetical protein